MSVETANAALANDQPNRGPFEVVFDDFKRKMATKNITITKLMTASPGTDEYAAFMDAFLLPENDTIEVCVGADMKTVTFYTIKYPTTQNGEA